MKKIVSSLFVFLSILIAEAQHTTTQQVDSPSESYKPSVLVIPFESKMYISDIDRNLASENNMNFQDIKAMFRAALDREIYIALKKYYKPLSFYSIDPEEAKPELAYIYSSIGYKYEVVPKEEVVKKETVGAKFVGKFKKKKKEEEYIEAGINNGEVVSQVDNREKYMKTKLVNENLMTNLDERYKASRYIFINELDIKKGADNVYDAGEEKYKREIKVHYTIFDAQGNELDGGAIKTRFPSGQDDIEKIIKFQFPLVAERIVNNLLEPDEAMVD